MTRLPMYQASKIEQPLPCQWMADLRKAYFPYAYGDTLASSHCLLPASLLWPSGASGQIRVDDLNHALSAEARVMPRVHYVDRQLAETLHRLHVRFDVRAAHIVQKRAVVDGVTRKECTCLCFPQADAAWGVSWKMENLKRSVSQVDDIAFFDDFGDGRIFEGVAVDVVAFVRECSDHLIAEAVTYLIADCAEVLTQFCCESCTRQCAPPLGAAQIFRFQLVNQSTVEFVMAADVIEVGVCRDCRDFLVKQVASSVAQARDSHAGVNHQVAVTTTDMPAVALDDPGNVRFPEQSDVVVDFFVLKPPVCDR